MSQVELSRRGGTAGWLIFLGALWLLLAGALFYYQLAQPPSIKVEWETATELETAGFYLYRSQSPDGRFVRINEALIPGAGDTVSGASYSYTDRRVTPGATYYYVLEEVEYDATTNRYEQDIFSHTVPRTVWWAVLLTAVSLLIGLALLVMGIRERRT